MTRYPRITLGLGISLLLCTVYLLTRAQEISVITFLSSLTTILFAALPMFLWSRGILPGMPILPLHAFTLVWTYGLPLSSEYVSLARYDSEQIVDATFTVILYCSAATAACLLTARVKPRPLRAILVLEPGRGFALMTTVLGAGGLFISAVLDGGIAFDPGLFGIIRSGILALTSVALFVLSYRLGRHELTASQKILFVALCAYYVIIQAASLLLIGAIVSMASIMIGFILGRRRIPWGAILVLAVLFSVLHLGKNDMREEYWLGERRPVHVLELPSFFVEWIGYGLEQAAGREGTTSIPLVERLSMVHMLLFAQSLTPDSVPFMHGHTYEVIPELVVPRIFVPDKASSHEGTTRINLHYGIQMQEDAEVTTIAWGLLNEAWVNFGDLGVIVLGFLIGLLYGWIGRLTKGAPVMSMRVFIGATFAALALQSEFTMGVFVTVLLQSLAVLSALFPLLTRRPVGESA